MNTDELYNRIEELEKRKVAYLEVNNKANVRRIEKQIKDLELQVELFNFNKLQSELSVYKRVVNKYPSILNEVKKLLREQKCY